MGLANERTGDRQQFAGGPPIADDCDTGKAVLLDALKQAKLEEVATPSAVDEEELLLPGSTLMADSPSRKSTRLIARCAGSHFQDDLGLLPRGARRAPA